MSTTTFGRNTTSSINKRTGFSGWVCNETQVQIKATDRAPNAAGDLRAKPKVIAAAGVGDPGTALTDKNGPSEAMIASSAISGIVRARATTNPAKAITDPVEELREIENPKIAVSGTLGAVTPARAATIPTRDE